MYVRTLNNSCLKSERKGKADCDDIFNPTLHQIKEEMIRSFWVLCIVTLNLRTALGLSSDIPSQSTRRQAIGHGLATTATFFGGLLPTFPAVAETTVGSYLSDLSDFQLGTRGIQYKILQPGEGASPIRGQQVYTKYTLWTGGFGEDGGKQVDSNTGFMGRPLPVIVGIGRVIKGWDLTLLDMKVGEVRRIVIPSDLGYGDRGAGGSIPPKATLFFEVQISEMDPVPFLTDTQQKWLADNPL